MIFEDPTRIAVDAAFQARTTVEQCIGFPQSPMEVRYAESVERIAYNLAYDTARKEQDFARMRVTYERDQQLQARDELDRLDRWRLELRLHDYNF